MQHGTVQTHKFHRGGSRDHKLSPTSCPAYLGPARFDDSQTQVDVSAVPFNADRSEITVNRVDLIVDTENAFLQTNSRLRLGPPVSRAGTRPYESEALAPGNDVITPHARRTYPPHERKSRTRPIDSFRRNSRLSHANSSDDAEPSRRGCNVGSLTLQEINKHSLRTNRNDPDFQMPHATVPLAIPSSAAVVPPPGRQDGNGNQRK